MSRAVIEGGSAVCVRSCFYRTLSIDLHCTVGITVLPAFKLHKERLFLSLFNRCLPIYKDRFAARKLHIVQCNVLCSDFTPY
jgi:hypothetical protein